MIFQGNITLKPFTYKHLKEALKLDLDAAVPPLTCAYMDDLFYNAPKVEFIGAWQEAEVDDYVTDEGKEITFTESRLVGFAIFLPFDDEYIEIHHIVTHYAADLNLVGKEMLAKIKATNLPIKISVRDRNKDLASFLNKQGFKVSKKIKGGFLNPKETRIVYYYENH